MKALILNSGMGSRVKGLAICKCLIELVDGVTILDAQIQALIRCGIEEIYITTGANAEKLVKHATMRYPNVHITFVHNPVYNKTNYIYSIKLARSLVCGGDILLLHGDLIFEQNVLQDVLASGCSVMVVDSTQPLPEKDFKAVVKDGLIRHISVDVFKDAVFAQPMYKLNRQDWDLWLEEIDHFCSNGMTDVYAENAFNSISQQMRVSPLDIAGRICLEVDTNEDLAFAQSAFVRIPGRLQKVYAGHNSRNHIQDIFADASVRKPFVVCKGKRKDAQALFKSSAVYFEGFTPNPDTTEVAAGITMFDKERCDFIVSLGGGSAIDTAKCINMLRCGESIELRETPRARHLAIPTTAGTGSESTQFAVLFETGEKQSVEHHSLMPEYVILDPGFLFTLPLYHKKSSLLDAFCQSIESIWAKGQTPDSRAYALGAIRIILEDIDGYFANDPGCALRILQAAGLSGKAINISKTTAAHAMSYKLSTMFGLAHGHAVSLCLPYVWAHLIESGNTPECLSDADYDRYMEVFVRLDVAHDFSFTGNEGGVLVRELVAAVDIKRLANHPVDLTEEVLTAMYEKILGIQGH